MSLNESSRALLPWATAWAPETRASENFLLITLCNKKGPLLLSEGAVMDIDSYLGEFGSLKYQTESCEGMSCIDWFIWGYGFLSYVTCNCIL